MVNPISPAIKWLVIIQTSVLVFLLLLFIYVSFWRQPTPAPVTTYEECLTAKGSVIQESYPATCITQDKQRFIQPL
jgi:hypothetical protein